MANINASLMPAARSRDAIKRLGLTQAQAAWLFAGKSRQSGRRWATEGAPYAVALLLDLMEQCDINPETIEAMGQRWRQDKTCYPWNV